MSTQCYKSLYNGERLESITFTPSWAGSNGFQSTGLGQCLFRRNAVIGWNLKKNGELIYVSDNGTYSRVHSENPLELVDICQRYITEMMDEAYHQLRIAQAIAEAHAEGICV